MHGDAAFAGEGIVQELFNLSGLPGFATGGALHVVVNNQIGFTTPPSQEGRSTQYATDVARMLQIPIFHVNGERPEAVDRVVRLALEFRQTFGRDVVVDMYCYRLRGHNERDEPSFTQPRLYAAIARRDPVRTSYARNLVALGEVSELEAAAIAESSLQRLRAALAEVREGEAQPRLEASVAVDRGFRAPGAGSAIPASRAESLLQRLGSVPEGFSLHPKIERLLAGRRGMAAGRRRLDWGAGEALALASLLTDGVPVRLTGQDCERGTFGHRHAVLHHAETGDRHLPLAGLAPDQAPFSVFNSPLSETGVLGFEFGYALERPEALVIWEAQFGDFCNVAQVIVDQFVATSGEKWRQPTSLCLLLPHGLEGQGPEHSSARLERFLQLAAGDNVQIVQPTTAAQVFHLLRRQGLGRTRRRQPLIVLTPKRLLQHPSAAVPLERIVNGAFLAVIRDPQQGAAQVRRVVLCSGQLHETLERSRRRLGLSEVALVRLEQHYPFPATELAAALETFPAAVDLIWGPGRAGEHGSLGLSSPTPNEARPPGTTDSGGATRGREPGLRFPLLAPPAGGRSSVPGSGSPGPLTVGWRQLWCCRTGWWLHSGEQMSRGHPRLPGTHGQPAPGPFDTPSLFAPRWERSRRKGEVK